MDHREELKDLIAQAKEHLLYFSELGLTSIGERSAPDVAEPKVQARFAEQTDPITPEPAPQESPAPTIIPPPQFVPKPVITMPTKKENTAEPSLFNEPALFGEPAAPMVETRPVNETLEDIRLDLGDCQRCKLWSTRANIVFGEGNPKA